MSHNVILFVSAVVYFQLSLLVLNYFDEHADQPYMDEIFHVPQAQEYCRGNYNEWNDKITTLPGLYLLSTSVLRLIAIILKTDHVEICTVYNLRLSNVILSTLNFIVIFQIFTHIHSKRLENNTHSRIVTVLSAFSISLFPLNYFFQFLYYTDSGSTLFVLVSYYLQLKKYYQSSAYVAALAILYRQTNVVWLGFSLALLLVTNLEQLVSTRPTAQKNAGKVNLDANTLNSIAQNRSKKHSVLIEFMSKTPNEAFSKDLSLFKLITKIYKEDLTGKKLLFADLVKIVEYATIQPFIFTLLTFAFFVFVNKGIVVGDKKNHEASLHLVQIFYFASFACFFSLPSFIFAPKKLKNLLTWLRSTYKILFLVALPLSCVVIRNFTYEHPFLLADNRHYTFYLWLKLFRRHELVKYSLIPFYLSCMYLCYRNLTLTGKSLAWLITYSICTFAVLVPQQLIEFRYFIVPFYIYRLNINQTTLKEILLEILMNGLINFVTIYVFFYRTFYWPNDPVDVQRFMW